MYTGIFWYIAVDTRSKRNERKHIHRSDALSVRYALKRDHISETLYTSGRVLLEKNPETNSGTNYCSFFNTLISSQFYFFFLVCTGLSLRVYVSLFGVSVVFTLC